MANKVFWVALAIFAGSCLFTLSGYGRRFLNRGSAEFVFIIEPYFAGDLRLVDDPTRKIDDFIREGKLIVCQQKGNTMPVPQGFIIRHPGGVTYKEWTVEEVRDTTGKVLSRGFNPPFGQVSCRDLSSRLLDDPQRFELFFVFGGLKLHD